LAAHILPLVGQVVEGKVMKEKSVSLRSQRAKQTLRTLLQKNIFQKKHL
jgi:hypothetical protein